MKQTLKMDKSAGETPVKAIRMWIEAPRTIPVGHAKTFPVFEKSRHAESFQILLEGADQETLGSALQALRSRSSRPASDRSRNIGITSGTCHRWMSGSSQQQGQIATADEARPGLMASQVRPWSGPGPTEPMSREANAWFHGSLR
ncbi:hypothetical protein RRG08_052547 [Elysia crispata]|uniref:Uncharacterized protein n=1 Tax=Elysia crispata TaxID=231223 RepID=A0AAE0Z786_9GAST|nr:hypothetical protein RRG08_052547 [Elysia crispata]